MGWPPPTPDVVDGQAQQAGHHHQVQSQCGAAPHATTVPPAEFASLIGISISAATRWVEHAGGNWTTYAAIRTKATDSPRQNQ
jgi:hypothetical protein